MKPFTTWGPVVPGGEEVYLERPVDVDLLDYLRRGKSCSVRGGRQSGKTSAMAAAMVTLEKDGQRWTRTDLAGCRGERLVDAWSKVVTGLLKAFGANSRFPGTDHSGDITQVTDRFYEQLEEPGSTDRRLYACLDEADSFVHRFPPDDVLEWLLSLRVRVQDGSSSLVWVLGSLRPLAAFVAPSIARINPSFAQDLWVQPFPNEELTWRQIHEQGFPDDDPAKLYPVLREVLALSGGQAQLSCAVLDRLQRESDSSRRAETLGELREELCSGGSAFLDGHLRGLGAQVCADPTTTVLVLNQYERVLKGESFGPLEGAGPSGDHLINIGLLRVEGGRYVVANPIYAAHLTLGWVEDLRRHHDAARLRGAGIPPRSTSPLRKVALLMVGGTMGMVTAGHESTFDGAAALIESEATQALANIASVHWELFQQLDGINVLPEEWRGLANWIHAHKDDFDGFVVCHGTDTLAWTASAVAFMLGRSVEKPVVFTGSQCTISIPHGDMLENLRGSCFVASHVEAPREVQVQFGASVYRAVRAEKADDRLFRGFRSPGWPELAQVSEELLLNRYALVGRGPEHEDLGFQPNLSSDILMISIVPGMLVRHFEAVLSSERSDGIAGVIVHTPGAGNIPFRGGHNYRDVIRSTVEHGVPVLVTSQVPINPYTQAQYEMSRAVTDYGAILAGDMTFPAAHAKFAWVIGCVDAGPPLSPPDRMAEIARRMYRNYQGEQAEGPPRQLRAAVQPKRSGVIDGSAS